MVSVYSTEIKIYFPLCGEVFIMYINYIWGGKSQETVSIWRGFELLLYVNFAMEITQYLK